MVPRIAILAFDGISAFHLAVPHAVFGEDRRAVGVPRYRITVCAERLGEIRTSMGLSMRVSRGIEALKRADRLIIPSWDNIADASSSGLLRALRSAHGRGVQIVGLCLGAFPIAEAGLLDGRSATTHWASAKCFAQRFPEVALDPQVLYIDHGDVVTSAGTAAGLDCCLHLLRQDVGAEIANRVARRLVVPPHRQGGQAQFVEDTVLPDASGGRIAATLDWARARLGKSLDIETLAEHAAMSRRSFTRHFQKATGMSVVPWLTAQRVLLAQRLLETGNTSVEAIATQAGFGSALSLRIAFAKTLHTTPSRYRHEFQLTAAHVGLGTVPRLE